jgi:aromatic-L-amino-acid decarboxylase
MSDFDKIILPGITHWQNPNFFAYFPANSSPASVLAEMVIATLGAQCMIWETSPAAAELEEKMMIWLRELISLPSGFRFYSNSCSNTYGTRKIYKLFRQYRRFGEIRNS